MVINLKTCFKCKETKPYSEFWKKSNSSDGYNGVCKVCRRAYDRQWYYANPDKNKVYQENKRDSGYDRQRWPRRRIRRHGISLEAYQEIYDQQDRHCAICGVEPELPLRIDHDHRCCDKAYSCGKCIRGLLCHRCNAAMGGFNDDPTLLRAAAAYLEGSVVLVSEPIH